MSTSLGCLFEPATGFTGSLTTMALSNGFACASASDSRSSSVYWSNVPDDAPQRSDPQCGWVHLGQCGLWPYCLWWWCRHHRHLLISQYQRTGFALEEAPIANGRREYLALLPFPAWLARSRFWIRTWEIIQVALNNWHSFVLHLQDSELLLELCKLGFKLCDFGVSLC